MDKISQLKIYSLGIVANNKKISSKNIEVTPIEKAPMLSGELSDNAMQYNSEGVTASGAAYSTEATISSTITASWLRMSCSNRETAPDVRRGETVVIYQFADTDQYYWATLLDDVSLRRLETVIYGFNANPSDTTENSSDNMYFIEISSHKKIMHIHTSTANGEPYAYDVQINAGDGCIIIQDDIGNTFSLDSTQNTFNIKNADGSVIDLNKKNLSLTVPETITMKGRMLVQEFTQIQTTTTQTTHTGNFTNVGNYQLTGGFGGQIAVSRTATVMSGDFTLTGTFTARSLRATQDIRSPSIAQGGV